MKLAELPPVLKRLSPDELAAGPADNFARLTSAVLPPVLKRLTPRELATTLSDSRALPELPVVFKRLTADEPALVCKRGRPHRSTRRMDLHSIGPRVF